MQCALLTQISQPVLTILSLSAIPSASCLSEEKTNSSSTGHCPQHSRRRLIRRLVLPATQPRNRNHLLHRLTGDPVSSRSSRIRSNDLSQLAISLHTHTRTPSLSQGQPKTAYNSTLESESQRRRSVRQFNRTVGVRVVICHSTEESSRLFLSVSSFFSTLALDLRP